MLERLRLRDNLADFELPRAFYLVDSFPTATLDKVAKHTRRERADPKPPADVLGHPPARPRPGRN